jgi:hypothetical protein
LTHRTFHWAQWGETLSQHPPTAFLPQLAIRWVFGTNRFALVSHTLQLAVVLGLLALTCRVASRRHGPWFAALLIGLVCSWPMFVAAAQTTTPDLAVGLFGLWALDSAARGDKRGSALALAAGGVLKLTVLSFLPGVFLLLSRHLAKREAFAASVIGGLPPVVWVALSWIRGAPSRVFDEFRRSGPVGYGHGIVLAGVRHVLEIAFYDGRWVLMTAVLIGLVAWRRMRWDSFDTACTLTVAVGLFVVTAVSGTGSLQRYLLPMVVPCCWGIARVVTSRRHPTPIVLAGILTGTIVCLWPQSAITAPDRAVAEVVPGWARSIDSNPTLLKEFVAYRQRIVSALSHEPEMRTLAQWPMTVYLARPEAGFTRRPLAVREGVPSFRADEVLVLADETRLASLPPTPSGYVTQTIGRRSQRISVYCLAVDDRCRRIRERLKA